MIRRLLQTMGCARIALGVGLIAAALTGAGSASADETSPHTAPADGADMSKAGEAGATMPPPTTAASTTGLWGRIGIGATFVADSATEGGLRSEGYWFPFHLIAVVDVAWFLTQAFGAGVWGAAAIRAEPGIADGRPTYRDDEGFAGAAFHARYLFRFRPPGTPRPMTLQGTARVGYAGGSSGFYSFATSRSAFAYGLEASFEFPIRGHAAIGVALGYVNAPTPAMGDLLSGNLGGFSLCFTASYE